MAVAACGLICSCAQKNSYQMGDYGYDAEFFKKNNVEFLELKSEDGQSKVLIVPGYQGRVMTSTAAGDKGASFGWINYKLVESGQVSPQFNPLGGEERFWIGPEGGPNSIYFKEGDEQVYANWVVPDAIDRDTYDIVAQDGKSVRFAKDAAFTTATGKEFKMGIDRTISLLSKADVQALLNVEIADDLNFIAYQTDNSITNKGDSTWSKTYGAPSIWLLGMFNPTPTTTVFIPYNTDVEGKIVNDEYFGKVPADRLIADNGTLFFKIDGKYRSKIGVPAGRAKELCGSYDSDKKVLTLVWCSLPADDQLYVNGQWGPQDDPFAGDVINAYNDGPVEDGSIMGPFYEIESSSPAAFLAPGESMRHIQRVMHIQGDEQELAQIVNTLFNLDLNTIATKFN